MEIPQPLRDKLEASELRPLIHRLATRVEDRRAGVNVARIVLALMHDMPQRGVQSSARSAARYAALYQALRDAVRLQVERMPDMHFIQGLS